MIGKLIDEVENNECLYSKKHPDFKDPELKEEIWHSIAAKFNTTAGVCKTKWKSLRDKFSKEIRKQSYDGSLEIPSSEWRYFRRMEFIRPYISPRKPVSFGPNAIDPISFSDIDRLDPDDSILPCSSDVPTESKFDTKPSEPDSFDVDFPEDESAVLSKIPDDMINSFLERVEGIAQKKTQRNTHQTFCDFLAERLEKFPDEKVYEIQLKFMSMLNEEEKKLRRRNTFKDDYL